LQHFCSKDRVPVGVGKPPKHLGKVGTPAAAEVLRTIAIDPR